MRTEEEILKNFEDLGWKLRDNYINFTLYKGEIKQHKFGNRIHHCYISIDKEKQTYYTIEIYSFCTHEYKLTMQEHKLLTELFEIWEWLL